MKRTPKLLKTRLFYADLLNQLQRSPEAIEQYKMALHYNPTSAKAHFDFGLALWAIDRQSESITHLREAVRLEPLVQIYSEALQAALQKTSLTK